MAFLGREGGPKKEEIMRRLGLEYFRTSTGGFANELMQEERLTEQKKVNPIFIDESGNPFYVFQTAAGLLRAYYFLMDERVALGSDFKKIELTDNLRPNLSLNYRVENLLAIVEDKVVEDSDFAKPWGFYVTFVRNQVCTPKVIGVDDELSLQSHRNRDEIWCAVNGLLGVYRGQVVEPAEDTISKIRTIAGLEETILQPGDAVYIPRGTAHSVRNLNTNGSSFVEVALGHADERDIIRFYDKSGRVKLEGIPEGLSAPEVIAYCRQLCNQPKQERR